MTDTFVNSVGFLTNMELFKLLFEYLAHREAQKIQLQFYSLPCKYMSTLLRCSVRGNSGICSKQSLERKDMEWENVVTALCVLCHPPFLDLEYKEQQSFRSHT